MKKTFLFLLFSLLLTYSSFSQNPWEKYGYKTKPALTLSNGEYQEFFTNDTIIQIGTVLFNTVTNQVIGFIKQDTITSEATLKPEVVSRWLSPDPLMAKYPNLSPYNFANNNPIIYVDKDGRDYELSIQNDANGRPVQIVITYNLYVQTSASDNGRSQARATNLVNSINGNSGFTYNYGVTNADGTVTNVSLPISFQVNMIPVNPTQSVSTNPNNPSNRNAPMTLAGQDPIGNLYFAMPQAMNNNARALSGEQIIVNNGNPPNPAQELQNDQLAFTQTLVPQVIRPVGNNAPGTTTQQTNQYNITQNQMNAIVNTALANPNGTSNNNSTNQNPPAPNRQPNAQVQTQAPLIPTNGTVQ